MKHFKMNIFLSLLFVIPIFLYAKPISSNETGTSLVRIPYKSPSQIASMLERGMDVLHLSPEGYLDVVADSQQLDYLFSLGVPVSVIGTREMKFASPALDENLGDYHTFAEMESTLQALEANYPSLASLQSTGESIELRPIYALKVSDNVILDEAEPEVLIMGCHHAREIMSVEIPLLFAQYLLENYGTLPEVTALVDAREIYFVPMVNPDGHYYVQHQQSDPWWIWWRKNRRNNGDGTYGVDLNRNYGYQWGYDDFGSSPFTTHELYRGTGPFSEPETQAVRDLCASRNFILALSYHSYGELLLYPWTYYFGYTPDHELFLALGDTLTSSNGYFPGNAEMGAIYLANGNSDDWAYGEDTEKNAFFCFTPEVTTYGFGPPDTYIQPTFDQLLPMNMLFLELADTPQRVLGPYAPTMYPIDDPYYPIFTVIWSGNTFSDPNPVASYELLEYKNLTIVPEDDAESLSPLWNFNGFQIGSRAYQGSGSYYSGIGNNLTNNMETTAFYRVTEDADTFSCWVWYDIELEYDYAYYEVSTDDGLTWNPIPGNFTTDYNPNGNNRGNGITGSSGGWEQAVFPLDNYLYSEIRFRLRYITDGAVTGEGIYFDLLGPVPTYEQLTHLGSSITDTTYLVIPSETGEFTYRVRAIDSDGHLSRWSGTVSIEIDDVTPVSSQMPLESRLGANYPNPFNPATRIPFTIGGKSSNGPVRVTLRIYAVSGDLVATLIDRQLEPNHYAVSWNGCDDSGHPVASGIYFTKLTVGDTEVFSRKLAFLK